MQKFNLKISGAAGEGIKVSALIFLKACFKQGLYVHGYTEYPSLIRGGLNTFQVCADTQPVLSPETKFNLEISLNDPSLGKPKNIFAVGLACAQLGLKLTTLQAVIKGTFVKKTAAVINQNLAAAEKGYQSCQNPLKPINQPLLKNQILLTGNDAISLGAIAGGMKFFTAYPMTPATSILHFLAAKAKQAQIVVRHGEDEIGVINMALGTSFAGVRSMVATS
ncbi:2-oxoacid:acceptor oxidoreductase family protein, partial [Microgenomates group bacterium]|nr:2-oxoacid:acceptor oxidoreductase family protein [Microgenomates group bacterium]